MTGSRVAIGTGQVIAALSMLLTPLPGPTSAPSSSNCDSSRWCVEESEINVRLRGLEFVSVPRPDPREYRYTNECLNALLSPWPDWCNDDDLLPGSDRTCEHGALIPPRWSKPRDAGHEAWVLDAGYTCPGDPDYPITFDDFARLPIDPSPAHIQPDQSWVYAGLETIAHTSGQAQGFTVELRGQVYNVGAIPQEFVWDFGDGSAPVTTTDPGAPWPDHTVFHVYTAAGTARPTLTTRWSGVFQIGGMGEWHEIPGTAETVSTAPELRVHAPRPRLVDATIS